jgi:hypothetical protein
MIMRPEHGNYHHAEAHFSEPINQPLKEVFKRLQQSFPQARLEWRGW